MGSRRTGTAGESSGRCNHGSRDRGRGDSCSRGSWGGKTGMWSSSSARGSRRSGRGVREREERLFKGIIVRRKGSSKQTTITKAARITNHMDSNKAARGGFGSLVGVDRRGHGAYSITLAMGTNCEVEKLNFGHWHQI